MDSLSSKVKLLDAELAVFGGKKVLDPAVDDVASVALVALLPARRLFHGPLGKFSLPVLAPSPSNNDCSSSGAFPFSPSRCFSR
jgi:hypothetical protein